MKQYQDLVKRILDEGQDVPDRTGTGTRSIFGHQMRFELTQGFPLVTTKRTFWRGAFVEMLWFLRGNTNIEWLHKNVVYIWDEWADENGDIGPMYGAQWREWDESIFGDQLTNLIDNLAVDPHSRRHVMTAWNVSDLPLRGIAPRDQPEMGRMALAPCHALVQFHVDADYRLHCQLYQRSADVFLGVPFNIAGYALLTHLLAHHLGYQVGEFIWTGGDCHLYHNHFEQAYELLSRTPKELPRMVMHHAAPTLLWDIEPHELDIVGYDPHPLIPAPVSV